MDLNQEKVLATGNWAPPLLLCWLCWLCCWPDDAKSDSSSRKHSRKPPPAREGGSRRRSSELFGRRFASSAVSLHLPGTSGHTKQPLSAHRSHEEIRSRRKSHVERKEEETRYHSAPSVIDEVLHRRDWERSAKDLCIPLNCDSDHIYSDASNSPEKAPKAESESSSLEEDSKNNDHNNKTCKKHYTNIKSSKKKIDKESLVDEVKDEDENIVSNFYIGDSIEETALLSKDNCNKREFDLIKAEEKNRSIFKAKEAKQSFNESIRSKDRPKLVPVEENQVSRVFELSVDEIDRLEALEAMDRSGAQHGSRASRSAFAGLARLPFPPPSVEPVGYEGGACYLAEEGSLSALRQRAGAADGLRARHASDGDILAPAPRPESGAFSESDLDLDLEASEERPPEYEELHHYASDRKETAI